MKKACAFNRSSTSGTDAQHAVRHENCATEQMLPKIAATTSEIDDRQRERMMSSTCEHQHTKATAAAGEQKRTHTQKKLGGLFTGTTQCI
eukprot:16161-Heterococcus_DN1.PRE.3